MEKFKDTNNWIFYGLLGVMLLIGVTIIVFISFSVMKMNELKNLETNQSPYCFAIQCPNQDGTQPPCFGYASRRVGENWACSNSPSTVVDQNGVPV